MLTACVLFVFFTASFAWDSSDYVDWHNEHRKLYDLNNLEWDENLATVAQAWADKCPEVHNSDAASDYEKLGGSGSVGENMAWATSTDIEKIIDIWAAEKDSWTCATNGCSEDTCGHWTQIVWGATTRIGCGYKACSMNLVVCNYASAGNTGSRPFAVANCNSGDEDDDGEDSENVVKITALVRLIDSQREDLEAAITELEGVESISIALADDNVFQIIFTIDSEAVAEDVASDIEEVVRDWLSEEQNEYSISDSDVHIDILSSEDLKRSFTNVEAELVIGFSTYLTAPVFLVLAIISALLL
eukprot:TRINITY_DN14311_c0_g1_i1.p1 TRINITY_DN14311_c0_g1~~TRINITY_DN14311_c0_g1_i1.p1  ORF type:complete len:302 (-),score=63.99 TRINITY_DN14311_c0_g1_i1:30-935(-)